MKDKAQVRRIDKTCVDAIDDIKSRIKEEKNVDISVVSGSRLLGEKYFRGQLAVIPYSEIPEVVKHSQTKRLKGIL